MMQQWVMGLGGSDHDFSAALMKERDIRVAIEQERLTRRKHSETYWYEDPLRLSIEYCLDAEGIRFEDVEMFVASDLLPARVRSDFRGLPLRTYPHSLCHAASAYLLLPPGTRAGILVYDGWGSVHSRHAADPLRQLRETFSFFTFGPTSYTVLGHTFGTAYAESDDFPIAVTNSIGMLYELVTSLLGYDTMDSGKTMGLSSHGSPRYVTLFEQFIDYGSEMSGCFQCAVDDRRFVKELERALDERQRSFSVRADIAASLQAIMNRTLVHAARFLETQPIDVLCIAGGCGLNTVANSALVQHDSTHVPVVIPPFCGDAGLGLGALWLYAITDGEMPTITFQGNPPAPSLSRPGRMYSAEECRAAAQRFYPRLAEDVSTIGPSALAILLAHDEILAVFNGRSEIGPRALGGRSIIASARLAMTREKLNRQIKNREPFRPLAPMVLHVDYDDYFEDSRCADPYMLKVARVRDRCRAEAPAIVHVDGTARVQVIGHDGDPFLIELLRAYKEITGSGVLMNTSFNRRGEPIVETPSDAIDAFLAMRLDGLYLGDVFYRPANPNT